MLHEVKLDGYRLTCWIDHGQVTLRRATSWTGRPAFPPLVKAAQQLPVASAVLDGEIVSVQPMGPQLHGLVAALRIGKVGQLSYFVSICLYSTASTCGGRRASTRKRPWRTVLTGAPRPSTMSITEGQGPAFSLNAAARAGRVVSKRRDSLYVGRPTAGWLKAKFVGRPDFVTSAASRPLKGSRTGLGAVSGRLLRRLRRLCTWARSAAAWTAGR